VAHRELRIENDRREHAHRPNSTWFAESSTVMAHKTVQLIIGRILTDEELRRKFLVSPGDALTSLRDMGLDLTNTEIDALARTDRRLWISGVEWIDSRLQRCVIGSNARTSRDEDRNAG
jgi:hypothetical protein